jgi:hypothetical protein
VPIVPVAGAPNSMCPALNATANPTKPVPRSATDYGWGESSSLPLGCKPPWHSPSAVVPEDGLDIKNSAASRRSPFAVSAPHAAP